MARKEKGNRTHASSRLLWEKIRSSDVFTLRPGAVRKRKEEDCTFDALGPLHYRNVGIEPASSYLLLSAC